MTRLSVNEMTTYRWSFEEDVVNYHRLGIRAMGVWRQKLSDYGERNGVRLLNEHQMVVSNLMWAGGFTGSDGHTYAESLRDAGEAIRLAHTLQATCLVIYSGGRNGHTQNHARRLFASALRDLLPLASEFDITLAVEPMHGGCAADWTFLHSAEDVIELCDAVGSPYVKLVFDTYHLGHDDRQLDRLSQLASRIAVVHLGDGHAPPNGEQSRTWLGHGRIPLRECISALEESGFTGHYDVELMGEEIEAADYNELLIHAKSTFENWWQACKQPYRV